MNHRVSSWVAVAALTIFLGACNVNVNDGNGSGLAPIGIQGDSGTTITTHSETHTETHSNFEIKGGVNSESHSTTHSTTTIGRQLSFAQQVDQWALELFPDYKQVEMDPMDAYPKYKGAQETIFKRIRVLKPISNDFGKSVYPRLLIKAYRFAAPSTLTTEVEAWLNGLGSSTKGIQLGQSVNSVKSPPLLCAVIGKDFLVVQGGCVYEGAEWTATKKLFFQKMVDYGAAYAWQIHCNGGKLSYEIGGAS